MHYPYHILAFCLAAAGCGILNLSAAEPLPYGHQDFVPTPERPMIFRAGGNGWYPGATPPTEWSEGTPVQIDMKGIYGSERKESVRKVWDFADTKSKNILWKVHRGRSDNKAMARFVIVDVKDPANPKMVSDKNWLGFAEPPSDIFIEQYYKDIDPFQFVGCYAGAVSQFLRMGGMVPVGNRLLIQTSAFLYCIGVK